MGSAPPEPMVPKQAYEILKAMAERYGEYEEEGNESLSSSISDWNVILLSDIGTSGQRVVSGSLSGISEFAGGMIHCLILPTEFSGMEKEIFESLKADM